MADSDDVPQCLRCRSEMESGGMYDPGGSGVLNWIAQPTGPTKLLDLFSSAARHQRVNYVIRAYRCSKCGFVELNAP